MAPTSRLPQKVPVQLRIERDLVYVPDPPACELATTSNHRIRPPTRLPRSAYAGSSVHRSMWERKRWGRRMKR